MRSIFALVLFAALSGCSTPGPMSGVEGGTGLTLGKADACRAFREALLAREYLITLNDSSNPDRTLLEGTASFQRHDIFPEKFAYRSVRDSGGDANDRHAFQLVSGKAGKCSYTFFDEALQNRFDLEMRREGDDILAGTQGQHGSFRLSPNVDTMNRRKK